MKQVIWYIVIGVAWFFLGWGSGVLFIEKTKEPPIATEIVLDDIKTNRQDIDFILNELITRENKIDWMEREIDKLNLKMLKNNK